MTFTSFSLNHGREYYKYAVLFTSHRFEGLGGNYLTFCYRNRRRVSRQMAFTQRLRLKTLELPQGCPLVSLLLLLPRRYTREHFSYSGSRNMSALPSSLISQPSTYRMSSMIPSLPLSKLPSLRSPLHLSLSLVLTSCRIPRLLSKAHFIPAIIQGSLYEELFQIFAILD